MATAIDLPGTPTTHRRQLTHRTRPTPPSARSATGKTKRREHSGVGTATGFTDPGSARAENVSTSTVMHPTSQRPKSANSTIWMYTRQRADRQQNGGGRGRGRRAGRGRTNGRGHAGRSGEPPRTQESGTVTPTPSGGLDSRDRMVTWSDTKDNDYDHLTSIRSGGYHPGGYYYAGSYHPAHPHDQTKRLPPPSPVFIPTSPIYSPTSPVGIRTTTTSAPDKQPSTTKTKSRPHHSLLRPHPETYPS